MLQRKAFRDGIVRTLEELQPQFAVTLAVNGNAPLDHGGIPVPGKDAKACIRSFHARLDRMLLGPRWVRKIEQRTKGIFLPEHPDSAVHYHGVLRIDPDHVAKFEGALVEMTDQRTGEVYHALPLWRDTVQSGSSCIRRISSVSGWGSYCCKDDPDPDHLIVL